MFRHPNDEVNYCCYLIPGNPKVTNDDLAFWHDKLMKEHPYVCKALGKNYKIERMKAGMYVYVCVYGCVCMYVCIYVHVYMYIV